ncbi:MAG: hypothetical protein ACK5JT_02285 [Hyphomicrobiaceae bacterium]
MASSTKLSRVELYDLVWSQPLKDLPEIVGASATSVKNTCRKFDIPVPDRGYWAKIKAGKSTKRVPLPDRAPGMSAEFGLGGSGYDRYYNSNVDLDAPLPPQPTFDIPIEEVRSSVAKKIGRVVVPRGKHTWHHIIQRLLTADDKRREKFAESRWAYSWDKPLFDNPFEQRRLRVMNALFLGVAKCGGKPSIHGKEAIEFSLTVHQQHVPLKLLATSDRARNNYYRNPDDHRQAKEPLSLIVPSHYQGKDVRIAWADADDSRLEAHLTEIAVELVVLAEVFHREHASRQHEWLIERKKEHEQRKLDAEAARLEAIRVRNEADRIDPVVNNRFLDVMNLSLEDFSENEG